MSALGIIVMILLIALALYEIISLVLSIVKRKKMKQKQKAKNGVSTIKVATVPEDEVSDENTIKEEDEP